jgi:hypothetical protein
VYGYRVYLLETLVERERFQGTSYRAANCQCLGQTQGRGKLDRKHAQAVPVKDIWGYPLHRALARCVIDFAFTERRGLTFYIQASRGLSNHSIYSRQGRVDLVGVGGPSAPGKC